MGNPNHTPANVGPSTKITVSLQTVITLVITTAMAVGIYSTMATEEYVDKKVADLQQQTEAYDKHLTKLDIAIQLLTQSVSNHDKNMEAFTTALERLREDMIENALNNATPRTPSHSEEGL